jgi:hypothetical protein
VREDVKGCHGDSDRNSFFVWTGNRGADDVTGHKMRIIEFRSIFLSGIHAVSPMPCDGRTIMLVIRDSV